MAAARKSVIQPFKSLKIPGCVARQRLGRGLRVLRDAPDETETHSMVSMAGIQQLSGARHEAPPFSMVP